jgi:hypothetical protein
MDEGMTAAHEPYRAPRVRDLGTVHELTGGLFGGNKVLGLTDGLLQTPHTNSPVGKTS